MNLTGETAETLRTKIFQQWEELAEEPARSGQPEGLMLELLSFIAALNNQAVQRGLEQNLINYATGSNLDSLALFWGLTRLQGEIDDRLRERILLAPGSLSRVGTEDGFLSVVKQVDASIIDVSAISPAPPAVEIRFIVESGLPDSTLIQKVQNALTDKRNKPVILEPTAMVPTAINFAFTASIDVYSTADVATIRQRCADAVNVLFKDIRKKIGRDVVVKQLESAMMAIAGVYSATVISPANTILIPPTSWANCPTAIADNIAITSTQPG